VHVAISTLRRLGLGAVLSRGPTGYYLDKRIPIAPVIHPAMPVASVVESSTGVT
jgi:hypothetical protein